MSPSKPNYLDNVYKRFVEMNPDEVIEYNPAKGTQGEWDKFVEAVKHFIRSEYSLNDFFPQKFVVEFNDETYSKIRKFNVVIPEEK